MKTRVAVVGGGASGIVAALVAARAGAAVTLFEKGRGLGRKILASGGGRCNLGNAGVDAGHYHGGDRGFVRSVLSRFGHAESLAFFEDLGLMMIQEPDGRLFPRSGQARSVLSVLESRLNLSGADVRINREVKVVRPGPRGFVVEAEAGGCEADAVILACGGCSYPKLGGGEGGLRLARSLGLSVVEPFPCLVPLVSKDPWVRKLQGVRVEAALSAHVDGRQIAASRGELLFTAYGISGPATLDLSREVCLALGRLAPGRQVDCSLNLFPEFSHAELEKFFLARARALAPLSPAGLLRGAIPEEVAEVYLAVRAKEIPLHESPSEDAVLGLARGLSAWKFTVCGSRPWEEAMVTAGGVRLAEVSPETMEARSLKGLHVTGELLDVDGDSGGYNLHFAWATGFLAGTSCSGKKC